MEDNYDDIINTMVEVGAVNKGYEDVVKDLLKGIYKAGAEKGIEMYKIGAGKIIDEMVIKILGGGKNV